MLVTSKEMLETAKKHHYAIPAANFIDIDSLRWHLEVAEEMKRPIILAFAECHVGSLITLEEAADFGKYYAEKAKVPVVLHLDHGASSELVKQAVDLGFTSVMIDASMEEFDINVQRTKEIVAYARKRGVVIEAEIGHVGAGVNYENHRQDESIYTTVDEARKFIEKTGVDSLAVSIGTAHGLYKGTPKINFERLRDIFEVIDTPLVLHGGSSSGDDNLKRCAQNGITKINIFSDFLMSASDELKKQDTENYFEVKAAFKAGMQSCLKHYYDVFQTPVF